ncbi:LOW QUALITY PROTEIN: lysoplasmalogenase-like protein TMEM86A [Episyrphus balteatus]|uniref:LOW QUALITY PROTEIN: lysoplasmalogenase-like protein TMEM86A n=1 Tax=Episyrphus balteatus TaxID=286459 RepID=UPI002486AE6F|nr:LOW QUALITY PROTEIN: lysoplasmalogenase-like protein TMEM86A [Episyrphus balteatus]
MKNQNQNKLLSKKFRKKIIDELNKFSSFIIFLVLYFSFVDDKGDPTVTTLLKCAPIISLGVYVISKGFKCTIEYNYSQMVLSGLFFSCIGDALLNCDLFPHGMAVFGIAQVFYISAFEMTPLKISIGIPLYCIAAGSEFFFVKFEKTPNVYFNFFTVTIFIYSSLSFIIQIGLPVYALLLTTMCWRAIVRATEKQNMLSYVAAVGSVLFVISDTLISVTMFVQPIPHARMLVMFTYYAAQFCISLSTLCDVIKQKKGKGSKKLSRKFRDQDLK